MPRRVLILSVALASLLLAGCSLIPGYKSDDAKIAETSLTSVGDEAPDFSVPLLDGGTFTLSEHRGKVVLVNWWATWCPPCLEEIPHLQGQVWERFEGEDFTMISISREETAEVVGAFMQDRTMTWPQAVDIDRSAYAKFAEAYIPRNYVIDAEGRILFQSQGYDPDEFEDLVHFIDKELTRIKEAGRP